MSLKLENYSEQCGRWPPEGRHILAQFDDETIVVYQAFSPALGYSAAAAGYFGGEFDYSRMSWIKPNFLWMMFRSGWGAKRDQEVTLAVRLERRFFESVLAQGVPSSFDRDLYPNATAWKSAITTSNVRIQWDPDHGPAGQSLSRRAIQLGLRGLMLEEYGKRAIRGIEDISEFVAAQRKTMLSGDMAALLTPSESIYVPAESLTAGRLKLSLPPAAR